MLIDREYYEELIQDIRELQAWKKMVCNIIQQQTGPQLRTMLKEMI